MKALRLKAKLTVEQTADKLEIAPTTIYGWETAYSQPKISDLPKIAAVYKVKKAIREAVICSERVISAS